MDAKSQRPVAEAAVVDLTSSMKTEAFSPPASPRQRRSGSQRWSGILCGLFILSVYYYWAATSANTASSAFDLREILLSVPSAEQARNWSAYYTSETHLAGQGLKQALWTQARWKELGISNTTISSHDTLLPMPTNQQRVALLENDKVVYEAPLRDSADEFVPAYFGFSANANISGSYVFCNFGSHKDFEALAERNVSLAGSIAIIKLGNASPYVREKSYSIFRAVSVGNAEKAGMIGVVLYTDPENDGPINEGNGYKTFPNGPARPLEAIERGGFGNIHDVEAGGLPEIPSIPISTVDAIHLLSTLNGHGPSARDLDERWQGGGLEFYGVRYNIGPSPPGLSLHLNNEAKIVETQVHNVVGTIPGATDDMVILGNHRDAWGPGAGDPGSGSAALNEVVRSFGVALQQGWRPERTIVFVSFEGEEFAQIGALLWCTKYVDWLRASAVAYLNVVVAASGSFFHAKASPLLYSAVLSATGSVLSPNQTVPGQSVRDAWENNLITAAGSGDANRLMSIPCVSTLDFGFSPALGEPAFPYHTGFDSFEWMDLVGDPGWSYHVTSAKLWSLLAAYLIEPGVLRMSVVDYAVAFQGWLQDLKDKDLWKIDMTAMTDSVERLSRAAKRFENYTDSLQENRCSPSWWKFWTTCGRNPAIQSANKVIIAFERQFYYEAGLDGHEDHHHAIFTPSAWHNAPSTMPGLVKNLESGHWQDAERWRDILSEKINDAARLLEEHVQITGH